MTNEPTARITIQFPLSLYEQFKRLAEEEDRSIASYVRLLVRNEVDSSR